MKTKRIDPEGCGCTDCLTGYSKPLNSATHEELFLMLHGAITNATSLDSENFTVHVHVSVRLP